MAPAALELTEIRHRYRRGRPWALDGVSAGPLMGAVALLGPNGAGKTTLFHVLSTAMRPTSGRFRIDALRSEVSTDRDDIRRRLGYLPQSFSAFGGYSCHEFLRYVAWLRQLEPGERADAIVQALEAVDLLAFEHTLVKHLSGGMRQRLGLAQAVVAKPRFLLLDEPTVGLDPEQRASFVGYLNRLKRSTTVVLATHLVEDVASFADTVVILKSGRVVFDDHLDTLCDRPRAGRPSGSEVEAAYLRALHHGTSG